MSEWWTYRPADFLMFAPAVYWRLFAALNEAWWPMQPVVVAVALTWLVRWAWPRRTTAGSPVAARAALAGLALAWAAVAGDFLLQRFTPINWPAAGYAAGFALQALGLLVLALAGGVEDAGAPGRRRVGLALGLWALLGQPLLAPAFGRPWAQAEVFGLAPDPTAIGTLAVLLLLRGRSAAARWGLRALWALPLAWCAVSAATLATLGTAQAAVPLAAALLALAAARRAPQGPRL